MNTSPTGLLHYAAADGATVTVVREDGRIHTGAVYAHPTEPDLFLVRSGRRGRPAVVHPDDVAEVIAE